MRIPSGDFGTRVAEPAQQTPQFSPDAFGAVQDQAAGQLDQAAFGLADEQHQQQVKLQDDLDKTSTLVAYQTHQTAVKIALQDAGDQLQAGNLTPDDYRQQVTNAADTSWQNTVGALPDSHFKNLATIQNQGLVGETSKVMDSTVNKYTQQQVASNVDSLLDGAAKNISVDPSNIDSTVASTKAAYLATAPSAGIGAGRAQQVLTNWENQQYFQHATQATLLASNNGDTTALDQLQKDLTDPNGFYAGKMNPQQTNQVLAQVISKRSVLNNQTVAQQNQADEVGRQAYNGAVTLFESGKQFNPVYQAQLIASTQGTPYAQQAQQIITDAANTSAFASLSLSGMQAQLQKDEASANTPGAGLDPEGLAALKLHRSIYTTAQQDYQSDPWTAAQQRGVLNQIPQLDTSSVSGLTQSLAARAAAAPAVENAAGRPVSLLTPTEAASALKLMQALPLDAQSAALDQIGSIYGNAGRIQDLSNQWKEKGPAVALALKYGAADEGGKPLLTPSGQPVSYFVLAGQQAVNDKSVKVDDTIGSGMQATIARKIGDSMPPQQVQDANSAAYLIAIGNAAMNGRASVSSGNINDAITMATGGLADTGGTRPNGDSNQVAVPYGWTPKMFTNAVKSATPANIENGPIQSVYSGGQQIPVDSFVKQLPSSRLMRVGIRGDYVVLAGNKPITDDTGKPVLIRLTTPQD